jgi:hypothetical protein
MPRTFSAVNVFTPSSIKPLRFPSPIRDPVFPVGEEGTHLPTIITVYMLLLFRSPV